MALKNETCAFLTFCIISFVASFLVYHPFFSGAVIDFYEGFMGVWLRTLSQQMQVLNQVSGVFLLLALVMLIIAGICQLDKNVS